MDVEKARERFRSHTRYQPDPRSYQTQTNEENGFPWQTALGALAVGFVIG